MASAKNLFIIFFAATFLGPCTPQVPRAQISAANQLDNRGMPNRLEREGNIFTVRIVPREKSLDLFVVGFKAANIKMETLGVEAFALRGNKRTRLKINREADHFRIENSLRDPFRLDIKVSDYGRTDRLFFDIP